MKFTLNTTVPNEVVKNDKKEDLVNIAYIDKNLEKSYPVMAMDIHSDEVTDQNINYALFSTGSTNYMYTPDGGTNNTAYYNITPYTPTQPYGGMDKFETNIPQLNWDGNALQDFDFTGGMFEIDPNLPVKYQTLLAPIRPDMVSGKIKAPLTNKESYNAYYWKYELRWDHYCGTGSPYDSISLVSSSGEVIPKEDFQVFISMGTEGPERYSHCIVNYRYPTEYVRRNSKRTTAGASHIPATLSNGLQWRLRNFWLDHHWMWWNEKTKFPAGVTFNTTGTQVGTSSWECEGRGFKVCRVKLGISDNIAKRIYKGETIWAIYNKVKIPKDSENDTFNETIFTAAASDRVAIDSISRQEVSYGYKEVINILPFYTQGTTQGYKTDYVISDFDTCDYFYTTYASDRFRIIMDCTPDGFYIRDLLMFRYDDPAQISLVGNRDVLTMKRNIFNTILVDPPVMTHKERNWNVRINAGIEYRKVKIYTCDITDPPAYDNTVSKPVLKYTIPELENHQPIHIDMSTDPTPVQSDPKTVKILQEIPTIFDEYGIQLPHKKIYFWEDGTDNGSRYGYPEYDPPLLYDDSNTNRHWDKDLTAGLVTLQKYSHGITIYRNDRVISNAGIENYDFYNSRIWFTNPVEEDDEYRVTYLLQNNTFIYTDNLDLNPHSGHTLPSFIDNYSIAIGLIPMNDVDAFDSINYIQDLAQTQKSRRLVWWYETDGPNVIPDVAYWLVKDPTNPIVPQPVNTISLIKDKVITLAKIGTKIPTSAEDLNIIDTRVRGGGLKSNIYFEKIWRAKNPRKDASFVDYVKEFVPDSRHFWDIGNWDGQPFRAAGFLIVRIPETVKNDFIQRIINNDNYLILLSMTDYSAAMASAQPRAYDLIRKMINKYVPAGSYWAVVNNDIEEWSPPLHSTGEHKNAK